MLWGNVGDSVANISVQDTTPPVWDDPHQRDSATVSQRNICDPTSGVCEQYTSMWSKEAF